MVVVYEHEFIEDVPLVEFMYVVHLFTRTSGDSYRRQFGSLLLWSCDVFRALTRFPS